MPFQVANLLEIQVDDISRLPIFTANRAGELVLDFNKIIPIPEKFNTSIEPGRMEEVLLNYIISPAEMTEEDWGWLGRRHIDKNELHKLACAFLNNYANYDAGTLPQWKRKNWGVSVGPVQTDFCPAPCAVKFITVNEEPGPVILQLAKMFPDVFVKHFYAADTNMKFTGERQICVSKGKSKNLRYDEDSKKASYIWSMCWTFNSGRPKKAENT